MVLDDRDDVPLSTPCLLICFRVINKIVNDNIVFVFGLGLDGRGYDGRREGGGGSILELSIVVVGVAEVDRCFGGKLEVQVC